MAWAASKSFDDCSGLVALTPKALTLTENLAPLFCLRSLIPLYSQDIAQGIAPSSLVPFIDPSIVFDCPVEETHTHTDE